MDERTAQELERRYELADGAGVPAVLAVYLIGSVLIGIGVISFVAWNWHRLPGGAKLALGASALVAAYSAGIWLAKVDGRRPLLGHALVLLGSLLFGANIGLVEQVFQLGGEFSEAAGLWAAGAALAGWLLDNTPSGILAAGLAVFWTGSRIEGGENLWAPFVPALVLLPLAFRRRSPVLFASVLAVSLGPLAYAAGAASNGEAVVASALASSGLLLALSYVLERRHAVFAAAARSLGTLVVLFFSYGLSFHDTAREMGFSWAARAWSASVLPQLAGLAACLALTARAHPEDFRRRPFAALELVATALVFGGALLPDPELPLAVLANLALCLLAGYGIVSSVHALERPRYWASVSLILLVIVSRFFEFETGLLLKAIVFTGCGTAVLVLGHSFERRVRAQEAGGA